MAQPVSLPAHMAAVADEERAILEVLGSLLPAERSLRPAISLATRNELVMEAKDLLDEASWTRFLMQLEHLHAVALANCIVAFPPPCYGNPGTVSRGLPA